MVALGAHGHHRALGDIESLIRIDVAPTGWPGRAQAHSGLAGPRGIAVELLNLTAAAPGVLDLRGEIDLACDHATLTAFTTAISAGRRVECLHDHTGHVPVGPNLQRTGETPSAQRDPQARHERSDGRPVTEVAALVMSVTLAGQMEATMA